MPHIWIEVSDNAPVDRPALLRAVHEAALATGLFPVGGARTRLLPVATYLIADGHPDNAFVHVSLRVGAGRPPEARRAAAEAVFVAARTLLEPAFAAGPIGLTVDMEEIDPLCSFKHNTMHDWVARRAGQLR